LIETFLSIQGEGEWAGAPAAFVRLSGCNARAKGLGCAAWCDTSGVFDPPRFVWTTDELDAWLQAVVQPLIVFTGGEPLLHVDTLFRWYTSSVARHGKRVAIETNGTLRRPAWNVWWTISPKPPLYEIEGGPISEVKVVLGPDDDWNATMRLLERRCSHVAPLFVQPRDNDLIFARRLVEEVLPFFPLWRLSLQQHKLLGVQ
jgi:organic radical activating enzyme